MLWFRLEEIPRIRREGKDLRREFFSVGLFPFVGIPDALTADNPDSVQAWLEKHRAEIFGQGEGAGTIPGPGERFFQGLFGPTNFAEDVRKSVRGDDGGGAGQAQEEIEHHAKELVSPTPWHDVRPMVKQQDSSSTRGSSSGAGSDDVLVDAVDQGSGETESVRVSASGDDSSGDTANCSQTQFAVSAGSQEQKKRNAVFRRLLACCCRGGAENQNVLSSSSSSSGGVLKEMKEERDATAITQNAKAGQEVLDESCVQEEEMNEHDNRSGDHEGRGAPFMIASNVAAEGASLRSPSEASSSAATFVTALQVQQGVSVLEQQNEEKTASSSTATTTDYEQAEKSSSPSTSASGNSSSLLPTLPIALLRRPCLPGGYLDPARQDAIVIGRNRTPLYAWRLELLDTTALFATYSHKDIHRSLLEIKEAEEIMFRALGCWNKTIMIDAKNCGHNWLRRNSVSNLTQFFGKLSEYVHYAYEESDEIMCVLNAGYLMAATAKIMMVILGAPAEKMAISASGVLPDRIAAAYEKDDISGLAQRLYPPSSEVGVVLTCADEVVVGDVKRS